MNVIRAFEQFVDDVSNWYIRRSRRRFYAFDEAAFRTLWFALVQSLRVMAPVLPFLTDDLWRNLVQDGPESVHLAPWPEVVEPDRALLDEVAEVRTVVTLGRKARDEARLKHRQPLRRLVVAGAPRAKAHADEIAEELRVREVEFGEVEASELRVKPNLPVLGPKLGGALREVREQLQRGEFAELERRSVRGRRARARARGGARRACRRRRLVGRLRERRHGRARHRARRRPAARGPPARPDPHGERAAQGLGPRRDRPDPPARAGRRRRARATRDRLAAETLAVSVEVGELGLEKV